MSITGPLRYSSRMLMKTRKRPELDSRDRAILDILQEQGRIPLTRLAALVGLSITPCATRLRRLERNGVIRRYGAALDARMLGPCVRTRVEITLAQHRAGDFARFEAAIRQTSEVIECDAVGGGIDYLMIVLSRDIEHYREVMEGLLARELGIAAFRGYVVTKRIKETVSLPLEVILSG